MDDIEEIKKLKARYFRFLDAQDWENYAQIFTPDVIFDTSGAGGERTTSRDEFVESVKNLGIVQSVHQGHMPEIEMTERAR